jgi:hypothetical protein
MANTCSVCRHRDRDKIERALLAGQPFRRIATQWGSTSEASLRRHKDHLAKSLVKGHEAQEVIRAGSLLADVRTGEGRAERLYAAAEAILERALEAEDLKTALNAVRTAVDVMGEARGYMELRGELTGELTVAIAADNVPLIRVLSVPRLPGVQTVQGVPALPAAEPTEQARSLPAAVESSDIPLRKRS